MTPRALLSWSTGKDSAWALHVLRQRAEVEVVGLVTTVNEAFDRVAMHGVRRELAEAQADAAGLPLVTVPLPWPCPNAEYEARFLAAVAGAKAGGVTAVAFGDLFLTDVRAYRERLLAGTGVEPLFPLWGTPAGTPALARAMLAAGLRATVTCLDPNHLPRAWAGREWGDGLPAGVDPCGERGEFHTFCHAGPMFTGPVLTAPGAVVDRDGFVFADLLPAGAGC